MSDAVVERKGGYENLWRGAMLPMGQLWVSRENGIGTGKPNKVICVPDWRNSIHKGLEGRSHLVGICVCVCFYKLFGSIRIKKEWVSEVMRLKRWTGGIMVKVFSLKWVLERFKVEVWSLLDHSSNNTWKMKKTKLEQDQIKGYKSSSGGNSECRNVRR